MQKEIVITHSKPYIADDDVEAVKNVLCSNMIAEGKLVSEFEHAIGEYLGLNPGVATFTGTAALYLAVKSLDIGVGDEVIMPTYVCRSVWDAISQTGAHAVFCDIGDDWCMNAETVKPHINSKTKAIIVVHIFGISADVQSICDFGVPVIEDCCQALGAKLNDNRYAGTCGDICCLSFHATKLLATGEGGMVLSKNKRQIEKIKILKEGSDGELSIRYRMPMTDLQAALGLSQLKKYPSFLEKRKWIADQYFDQLSDLPIELPHNIRNRSIFFRFPIKMTKEFNTIRKLFDNEGIQVRRGVDTLLHLQSSHAKETLINAETLFKETISLPLYPALDIEDIKRVISSCRKIFSNSHARRRHNER